MAYYHYHYMYVSFSFCEESAIKLLEGTEDFNMYNLPDGGNYLLRENINM